LVKTSWFRSIMTRVTMGDEKKRLLAQSTLNELIEQTPFNIAVIDRDYRIVDANGKFQEYFGPWEGRRCYEVYKGKSVPCPDCKARETFEDGMVRVSDETGHDRHGRSCHYVVHLAPLKNEKGEIPYVVEMSTDLTAGLQWQRHYNLLFERVPCYLAIIDKDFRIVRANEKLRDAFGEGTKDFCYEVLKKRNSPCKNCPARETFRDGETHTSMHTGSLRDGSTVNYQVITAPLSREEGGSVAHVIEIATDVTEVHQLQSKLQEQYDLYESLTQNSASGLVVLDNEGQTKIINRAARNILQWKGAKPPKASRLKEMLPKSFFNKTRRKTGRVSPWREVVIESAGGEEIPASYCFVELYSQRKHIGRAAFIRDLREIKQLEQEKLDAERLAAVGQTVAGLAHTIKNMLMGLKGGMYMVDTGMRKGDAVRIAEGWEVLQTNFDKTTTLVKDFLSFARGRLPNLKLSEPNKMVKAVYDLYRDAAQQQGVALALELAENIEPTYFDVDGIEASLTNLLSNAMDAVILRGEKDGRVILRTRDESGDLIFEVEDNGCGMDWEVKQQIFTTFFTTKGGEGTGLGLLTTRKIVQEHGGKIEVETRPEIGSVFRIRMSRKRLNDLWEKTRMNRDQNKEN
jgi:PAS domain S-box-containing protein